MWKIWKVEAANWIFSTLLCSNDKHRGVILDLLILVLMEKSMYSANVSVCAQNQGPVQPNHFSH